MEIHRIKIFGLTLLLAGLALCATGLWLLLSPAQYRATARIRMDQEGVDQARHSSPYDPYFIQTEFEVIQSEVVLNKVVEGLNLNVEWGRKYAGGKKLKTFETIAYLRRRINLRLAGGTKLIEILVTSSDPNEAAKIANEIALTYEHYCVERRQQTILNGIKFLEEKFQKEEQDIKASQVKLEQLREQLNLPNPEPREETLKSNYPSYFLAKQEYEKTANSHNLLKTEIKEEKLDLDLPKTFLVEITDPADPPASPSGPNRLLGGILLAMGIASAASGFFLLRPSGCQSA